jgi:hypothetical protein
MAWLGLIQTTSRLRWCSELVLHFSTCFGVTYLSVYTMNNEGIALCQILNRIIWSKFDKLSRIGSLHPKRFRVLGPILSKQSPILIEYSHIIIKQGVCNSWEPYAISTEHSTGDFQVHCLLRSISENCRVP